MLGLFAFVWMELASPNPAALPWVRSWLLIYALVLLGWGLAVRANPRPRRGAADLPAQS